MKTLTFVPETTTGVMQATASYIRGLQIPASKEHSLRNRMEAVFLGNRVGFCQIFVSLPVE